MPSVPRITTLAPAARAPPPFDSSRSALSSSLRATTAGSRRPRPMSASSSWRERAPESRTVRSQFALPIEAALWPAAFSACSSSRSPSAADSSYCMVLRK